VNELPLPHRFFSTVSNLIYRVSLTGKINRISHAGMIPSSSPTQVLLLIGVFHLFREQSEPRTMAQDAGGGLRGVYGVPMFMAWVAISMSSTVQGVGAVEQGLTGSNMVGGFYRRAG
jgi:hypothetical protein